MTKKTLLVLGGGCGGIALAKAATKADIAVVVVDRKEFFDVTFANVRVSVRPAGAPGMAMPYAEIPGMGTVKMGVVTELTKSSATLEGGEVIPFDYCAICTGSTHKGGAWVQPQGTTISEREAEIKATSEQAVDRFLGFVDACDEVAVDFARIYLHLTMDIMHCTDTEFASVTRVVDRIIHSFTDVVKQVSIQIDEDELFKHAIDILPESVSSLAICAMPRKETIDAISALKRPLRVRFLDTFNVSKSLVQLAVDAEALVPGLKFNISGTEEEEEGSEEGPEEEPESDDLL
ncbi:hypothetical protein FOA52_005425 [Chlamydomonas sp. UWO 241]|nr:hypothetical protein FOA52_005425 [Chlamydomonas sp. UWO 241]